MSRGYLALSLVVVAGIGCGGGGTTGQPLHSFPSRADLSALAARTASNAPIAVDMVPMHDLQLELPAAQPEHPVHTLLATTLPAARPSAALDCVAHELGRITLADPKKRPDISTRRFIAARCGALVAQPAFNFWVSTAPASESDAAVVARLREHLHDVIDPSATDAGAALVRDAQHAAVVLVFGKPQIETEPFSQVVDASGALAIRGRLLIEADAVLAYINAGEYGVKPCALDPAIAPPAFALRCELAAGDEAAWVQVMVVPHGRVLGREVLSVLALRAKDAATTYHRAQPAGESQPLKNAAEFEAATLPLVNRVREHVGLNALQAASAQSHVANMATAAYFSAMLSDDPAAHETVDGISLGLLAGWDVQGGMIRSGNLIASMALDSTDPQQWLVEALEQPIGRVVLLEPDARALALGAVTQQQPALLCAVAVTYAFFQDEDKPRARAMQVLERLGRVRKARGLGRTVLVSDAPGMESELARVHRSEVLPIAALHTLMQNMASSTHRGARGFVWETQDLDAIEFPSELLQKGDLILGAGVTYYRAKGGAWGQYVVLFVVLSAAGANV